MKDKQLVVAVCCSTCSHFVPIIGRSCAINKECASTSKCCSFWELSIKERERVLSTLNIEFDKEAEAAIAYLRAHYSTEDVFRYMEKQINQGVEV